MIFKDLIQEVKTYTHYQGTEIEELIKTFINDGVLDFLRAGEWRKLEKNQVITLDDSDIYDLTDIAIITAGQFFGELYLILENGLESTKLDMRQYLVPSDKSGYWSISGTDLHVVGNLTDINFGYQNLGLQYPLADDGDEIPATIFYSDIIIKWASIKILDYTADPTVKKEEGLLDRKLISTKASEQRIRKKGQLMNFARPS